MVQLDDHFYPVRTGRMFVGPMRYEESERLEGLYHQLGEGFLGQVVMLEVGNLVAFERNRIRNSP